MECWERLGFIQGLSHTPSYAKNMCKGTFQRSCKFHQCLLCIRTCWDSWLKAKPSWTKSTYMINQWPLITFSWNCNSVDKKWIWIHWVSSERSFFLPAAFIRWWAPSETVITVILMSNRSCNCWACSLLIYWNYLYTPTYLLFSPHLYNHLWIYIPGLIDSLNYD